MKTSYSAVVPYVTKDGSLIRELMHPGVHAAMGSRALSLAEAEVPPGGATVAHRHLAAEEVYHVVAGAGRMRLGGECLDVGPGDTVVIPPGTPHAIANTGPGPLRVLCACSPAYAHEDTELLEP